MEWKDYLGRYSNIMMRFGIDWLVLELRNLYLALSILSREFKKCPQLCEIPNSQVSKIIDLILVNFPDSATKVVMPQFWCLLHLPLLAAVLGWSDVIKAQG